MLNFSVGELCRQTDKECDREMDDEKERETQFRCPWRVRALLERTLQYSTIANVSYESLCVFYTCCGCLFNCAFDALECVDVSRHPTAIEIVHNN